MEEIVYLNGSLMPRQHARISPMDYGFLYGYGLFETMRAYGGVVFRLESHLKRLADSAVQLAIPVEIPALRKAVAQTLQANSLQNARVRLAVSIGEGSLVPDPQNCLQPTVFAAAAAYTGYQPEVYEKGFRLMVSSIRRNRRSPLSRFKSANYLECLLSRQEARSQGADDALLLNENGCVGEASSSNVFLSYKGILKTPRLENGILPGITRAAVLELAVRNGIEVMESDISFAELSEADEVFLTNSIIEIMPVTTINGQTVGGGKPGGTTRRLMEAYKDLVKKETGF
jgi:branched-chain amino acid aminotransferase